MNKGSSYTAKIDGDSINSQNTHDTQKIFDQKNPNNGQKPFLLITLSTTDILNIVDSMLKPMYNIFEILSRKYLLIFAVDSGIIHALSFMRKLRINDGYIISKCGAAIYNMGDRRIIKMSNMENYKILQIFHQVAIDFDLIVLRGQRESFIFGIDNTFVNNKLASDGEIFVNSYDYSKGVKFIKTHKINSIQVFFKSFDAESDQIKRQKIINLAVANDLTVTSINDGSFVITDSKIRECVDAILENEHMSKAIYGSLLLTNIFNENHNLIIDEHVIKTPITTDDLYRERTFNLFNNELLKTIKNSHLFK